MPNPSRTAPAASPLATPGVLGQDWGQASLEQPPGDPLATIPPYQGPNSLGHPGRYQGGQASVRDVAAGGPGFVAVGYILQALGPRATAWASMDGRAWTLRPDFPGSDASVAWSVATNGSAEVAVGVENGRPAAWFSGDGLTWSRASPPRDGERRGELRAVAGWKLGFVAVGSDEDDRLAPKAIVWTSVDGRTWEQLPAIPDFAGARAEGVSGMGDATVAVGTTYLGKDPTGAVSWRSADAGAWQRSPASTDLAEGEMHAVTERDGSWLAVGADLAGERALVWSSPDGLRWTLAPDAPDLDNYGLQIEMRDVVHLDGGDIAVGHLVFGTQYPTGLIWRSMNGTTWTRVPGAAVLEQVKFSSVTGGPGWAIAAGDFGGPDAAIPQILVSPWPP